MRTSSVYTISLPPSLATAGDRLAKSKHMTRSELHRNLLRNALAETELDHAITVFDQEKAAGKIMTLSGPLTDLLD